MLKKDRGDADRGTRRAIGDARGAAGAWAEGLASKTGALADSVDREDKDVVDRGSTPSKVGEEGSGMALARVGVDC